LPDNFQCAPSSHLKLSCSFEDETWTNMAFLLRIPLIHFVKCKPNLRNISS